MWFLLAIAVPTVQVLVVALVVLVILGVAWKFIAPQVSPLFLPVIYAVAALGFLLLLLKWLEVL